MQIEAILYIIAGGAYTFIVVLATIKIYNKVRKPDVVYHQDIKNKKNNGDIENVMNTTKHPVKSKKKRRPLLPFLRKKHK